jgi:hypothetical protein
VRTMFNADEKVYAALTGSSALKSLVGNRIYHNGVKDGGTYPSVWYGEASNTPALFADDTELYAKSTYSVSILSVDSAVNDIAKAVEDVMLSLGFKHSWYGDSSNGGVKIKSMRFIIAGKDE